MSILLRPLQKTTNDVYIMHNYYNLWCIMFTLNREYFVSKIFQIFIFRMYKFSYVRTLLFTNTVYFQIPVYFRFFFISYAYCYTKIFIVQTLPELGYKWLLFVSHAILLCHLDECPILTALVISVFYLYM